VSFEDWDLSDLSDEEQGYFWSGVQKSSGDMDNYEEAAYNKAAARNMTPNPYIEHPENYAGGFGEDPKDLQYAAAKYAAYDDDSDEEESNPFSAAAHLAHWAERTVADGGIYEADGSFVAGAFADEVFYPDDRTQPAIIVPQGAVDKNGVPLR
jgi:hypothetical protein